MADVRVKICGLTTAADAKACHELGADYLGVIFAESPRQVDLDRAVEIRAAVPDAKLVGVFADQAPDQIAHHAETAGLDLIQLHGRESGAVVAAVRERGSLPVIQALTGDGLSEAMEFVGDGPPADEGIDYFLFDLPKGMPFSAASLVGVWQAALWAGRAGWQVFLAGALEPDNAAKAVRTVRPFGVDVCSGVENCPGSKDLAKVERFIAEVRGA